MLDLEVLNGVFNVDEPARTVFHVNGAGRDQFPNLPAAQVQRRVQRPWGWTVHEVVTKTFDATAQPGMPCDVSQLDQNLSFKRRGGSSRAVVAFDVVERIGQQPFFSMRPQADVELKNAFLFPGRAARNIRR